MTSSRTYDITVVGGGLAGTDAAWQAARRGCRVLLCEMRPGVQTPAHRTGDLAELVCSNSFGSKLPDRARGVLLQEMRQLGSLVAEAADATAVPAGAALAVDRDAFAAYITGKIESHPSITLCRQEVTDIPQCGPAVLCTGPLTSTALSDAIRAKFGEELLYFYDAMAPIVDAESIEMNKAFRASRHDRGETREGDYINCPFDAPGYHAFVDELITAETIELRNFEKDDKHFFEACLPVEILARRNPDSLRFGPLTPIGLTDPHTGRRPYAALQLRQDNAAASLYSIVGAQTNLKWGEQERIFRMAPGLERAEFVRFGQMHRNTYINAPKILLPTMQTRQRANLFFAGQLAGVEGYLGDAATGWLAGENAARLVAGNEPLELPHDTMLGALTHYLAEADAKHFQPMKANFGIMPPLPNKIRGKQARKQAHAGRAQESFTKWLESIVTM